LALLKHCELVNDPANAWYWESHLLSGIMAPIIKIHFNLIKRGTM
jgi:hypothetical protein